MIEPKILANYFALYINLADAGAYLEPLFPALFVCFQFVSPSLLVFVQTLFLNFRFFF